MVCSFCKVGEVELKEVTMVTKKFHVSDLGKKEQEVDMEQTSVTFGHCDYCFVMTEYDLDEEWLNPIATRSSEELLDELGIKT
jgi:hypothetical protein